MDGCDKVGVFHLGWWVQGNLGDDVGIICQWGIVQLDWLLCVHVIVIHIKLQNAWIFTAVHVCAHVCVHTCVYMYSD